MDKLLAKKYFNDQCSPEEAQRVEAWLRTPEGQRFMENEIDRDIRAAETFGDVLSYPDTPSEKIFEDIRADISEPKTVSGSGKSYYLGARVWVGMAAAILLSLFVVLFVAQQNEHIEQEQSKYPEIVKTEADADSTIKLTDGSVVHLNSDSELIINKGFDSNIRSVKLIGKAYFEIESNPARPFLVQTDHSYIRVLGTKFEVEAYPDLSEVRVKVDEGKVRFFSRDERVEPIDLVSNESGILRFNPPEEVMKEEGEVNPKLYEKPLLVRHRSVEKEDPKIKFVDNRLFIALNYLERHYDVEIELKNDSLRNTRFTLTTDQSLLGAVERIADSLDLRIEYDREKDKLYLKQRE